MAPFAQYAQQYQYSSGGTEELADTGGPSLLIPAEAGTLVLGACIVGLFVAARRGSRVGDLGAGQQMAIDLLGPTRSVALAKTPPTSTR